MNHKNRAKGSVQGNIKSCLRHNMPSTYFASIGLFTEPERVNENFQFDIHVEQPLKCLNFF